MGLIIVKQSLTLSNDIIDMIEIESSLITGVKERIESNGNHITILNLSDGRVIKILESKESIKQKIENSNNEFNKYNNLFDNNNGNIIMTQNSSVNEINQNVGEKSIWFQLWNFIKKYIG